TIGSEGESAGCGYVPQEKRENENDGCCRADVPASLVLRLLPCGTRHLSGGSWGHVRIGGRGWGSCFDLGAWRGADPIGLRARVARGDVGSAFRPGRRWRPGVVQIVAFEEREDLVKTGSLGGVVVPATGDQLVRV